MSGRQPLNAWALLGVVLLGCAGARTAAQPLAGEIRIWGSPADEGLLRGWTAGFGKLHPGVRFSIWLHGPESTFAGVYTGVANLGLMAREIRLPVERMAYRWIRHREPFLVEVANAGLRSGRPSANLAIYVHEDNPISRLDLAQLDAILGAEHKRGHANARRWGELGLQGEWKDRPIHVYGPAVDSVAALHLRTVVMQDSRKWNPDYRELPGDREILDALARDPAGIAVAPLAEKSGVKPLALAAETGAPASALNEENVRSRSYPLFRRIVVALDRAPAKPIDPAVKELLRYILGAEGQAVIARDGSYISLSAETARQQVSRLESRTP